MTKPEYLTYVSLYMAGIDTRITEDELSFIRDRFGEKTFEDIKWHFDAANESERVNLIKEGAKRLNIDTETLKTELRDISSTDGKVTSNENYLINFIVKLLG